VVEESIRQGIEVLTLFAFSSENWRRPQSEVDFLMQLFLTALRSEVRKLKEQIAQAEATTAANDKLILQIAANYGGRWDLTEAARRLAREVAAGRLDPNAIEEASLVPQLATGGLPDPDLFIRTGGEQRLSNFLLWQSAYAELYFTDLKWPDFGAAAFADAIADFGRRHRRFGQTSEQLAGGGDTASEGSGPESPHDPDRI